MYADYEYYDEKFACLNPYKIDEPTYNALAVRAEAYLDSMTMNRLKDFEEIPECVKNAFCAVIDVFVLTQKAKENMAEGKGDISSEKTGEESVNYSYARLSKQAGASVPLDNQLKNAVYTYLSGTGLLYRGVR